MIYNSAYELIGKTPLIRLNNIERKCNLNAKIYAKVEYFNPAGSIKDRTAKSMIEDAENKGLLKKGATIIEPTSGNTGIGIASIATMKGYNVILTMPENMSLERIKLLKAYGASIVLTPANLGMRGAIEKANEIQNNTKDSIILGQFDNKANAKIHYETTGPEIYNDLDGNIDVFVCCVGTGGTITGTGKYLKEKNKNIEIIAVEPESSPLLSKGYTGSHKIQGIGANFIPSILDTNIYDKVVTVSNDDAFKVGKLIGKTEGFLVGISSGACLCAAMKLLDDPKYQNKNIVVIFPDSGDRYLSTPLFEND